MLSEEITRMAETELQSCEIERQKPEEIKEVSSNKPLSDEDDEQINNIGMHKKIYRKGKISQTILTKKYKLRTNRIQMLARIIQTYISANNMEETEQNNSNREFEQVATKNILNSSAQDDKERQDISSENNEEKDNSNNRVSEESNESLLGRIVKRFKFK